VTGSPTGESAGRQVRADARRNIDALLEAATTVFATSGVDAPVREIAACADAAPALAAEHSPGEALRRWLQRYTGFIAAKQGLAAALHSGDPAFEALPAYFDQRFRPALGALPASAAAAGEVRADVDVDDLLRAVANLCLTSDADRAGHSRRMVALLIDGLRYGPGTPAPTVVGTAPDHG